MTRESEAARKRHHELSENANKECSKACQHHRRIYKSIKLFNNDIISLVTKVVMLEKNIQDICLIEV